MPAWRIAQAAPAGGGIQDVTRLEDPAIHRAAGQRVFDRRLCRSVAADLDGKGVLKGEHPVHDLPGALVDRVQAALPQRVVQYGIQFGLQIRRGGGDSGGRRGRRGLG